MKIWKDITAEDVREAIGGSLIDELVKVLESVTKPPLPLELTILKALAMAGCALSGPKHGVAECDLTKKVCIGINLSRFKINTGGGQSCNIWGMAVAPSGSGKDIGNIAELVAQNMNWYLGSSGSAEGLADALITNGNGLLAINELDPYLERNSWQSKAIPFLTSAWNKGTFKSNLSQRGKTVLRESLYCYPNILANVQPAVLEAKLDPLQIESGFIARFLITQVKEEKSIRPNVVGPEDIVDKCVSIAKIYQAVEGSVNIPEGYLQDVLDEFCENGKFPAIYNRLVNEYGPRFAVMLAIKPGISGAPVIEDIHWERASVMARWFYQNAVSALSGLEANPKDREREKKLKRVFGLIEKHGRLDRADLSHSVSGGMFQEDRAEIIHELEDRGMITITKDGKKETYSVKKEPANIGKDAA